MHYPRLRRVRTDAWRNQVGVRLLRGQSPLPYVARTQELAHSFGARSCLVQADRPRRIWLDFLHSAPKERDVPLPANALRAITEHLTTFPAASVTLPWEEPDGVSHTVDLVLTDERELPWWRQTFNSGMWQPSVRRAGVATGGRADGTHLMPASHERTRRVVDDRLYGPGTAQSTDSDHNASSEAQTVRTGNTGKG